MEYYAHTREDGERQTVKAHLIGVSKLAEDFSVDLLKPLAKKASLYHDIGKYALNFQKRLDDDKVKFSHAACGAIEYKNLADKNDCFAPLMEYCIAGHHTGLMDGGTGADNSESPTLNGTLKRADEYTGDSDYSAYATEIEFASLTLDEITPPLNELRSAKDPTELIERYAFFTKYVFSCLTDADFLDTELSTCSILGEKLPQARIHDKIKGIKGGMSSGCVLVGMKESAFESYGKKQSYNSNVSEKAMKMYTSAFNSLLADRSHYKTFDDMTIVYFAMKKNDAEECNMFAGMFSGFEDELNKTVVTEADRNINTVMTQLKQGRTADMPYDPNVEFYVAGFTPNSSRISQKFIFHDKFGRIFDNVLKHQQDISFTEGQHQVSIERIKRELISPKSSKEKVPSPLIAALFEAILKGTRYPDELLSTVITRVKTDSDEENNHFIKLNDTRAGLIKGCINRKQNKEEIKMSLDLENKNQAYLCGRLFAVLEKIQQDASGGGLNRTIKDSYFASACSKPSTVFPKLYKLSQNHIKKLSSPIFYNKLCGEILDGLDGKFPSTLSLDDQGRFIVGYAQQNKALYTKKSEE